MEGLRHSFQQQLVQSLAELLEFGCVGIVEILEHLGSETRDLIEANLWIGAQSVSDTEAVVAHQTDDVPWIRYIHGLSFISEELVR